jgi:hypothetical protein
MRKLKFILNDLKFFKALFSPFKPFGLKFYAGKIAIGTPYFFPRRWRKLNEDEVREKAQGMLDKQIKAVAVNPNVPQLTLDQWIEKSRGFMKAVPKKVGFDFVRLGWKTKWSDNDFRFEWPPLISFVFFKWQVAVTVNTPEPHYWECWLYYEYATDKTKSRKERVAQCREEFPQTWTAHRGDESEETIDYYNLVIKPKYLTPKK